MKELVRFTIYSNDLVCVESFSGDGTICKHFGDKEALNEAFLGSYKTYASATRVGHIPNNFVDAAVISENTFNVFVFVPSGKYPYLISGSTKEKFKTHYPHLVFSYKVVDGRLSGTKVVALDEPPKRDLSNKLFHYPYGNVNSDGRVCWGSNSFDGISSMRDLELFHEFFFSSPSNHDNYNTVSRSHSLNELVQIMKDGFNYQLLTPRKETLAKFVEDECNDFKRWLPEL